MHVSSIHQEHAMYEWPSKQSQDTVHGSGLCSFICSNVLCMLYSKKQLEASKISWICVCVCVCVYFKIFVFLIWADTDLYSCFLAIVIILLFWSCIKPHCVSVPHFRYPLLAIVNGSTRSIDMQVFTCYVSIRLFRYF